MTWYPEYIRALGELQREVSREMDRAQLGEMPHPDLVLAWRKVQAERSQVYLLRGQDGDVPRPPDDRDRAADARDAEADERDKVAKQRADEADERDAAHNRIADLMSRTDRIQSETDRNHSRTDRGDSADDREARRCE